jgi:putative transposase
MLYVRYPLSLRNVEDLAYERGIDICHKTVRKWVNRFGPAFAAQIRRRRVQSIRPYPMAMAPWPNGGRLPSHAEDLASSGDEFALG